ncbi:hypothetical protein ABPG74_017061 [Tetrahymena malaccensis]
MFDNIYQKHLFFTNPQRKIQQNCPFGILIGSEGTGKTALFKQLVNKNYIDQDIIFSEPQNFFSTLSTNENKFRILDTLGTCDENLKTMNALNLKLASIEGPVNRIFLLIKYERLGPMQKKFSEQMFYLQNDWKNLITIVITHWDREDTPENRNNYEEIKARLTDNDCSQQYPFIFIGKGSNKQQLCEAFYNNMCQNDPVHLQIDCFQIQLSLNENKKVFINQQKEEFKQIADSVFKKITNHNYNDKMKLLQDFKQKISIETQDLIHNFFSAYRKETTQIEINLYYLEIKKYLIEVFENTYENSFNEFQNIPNKKKQCFICLIFNKVKRFFRINS